MRLALDQGARHANYWQYGWGTFHTTLLAANAYQASEADDPEDRYDARVNAVTSALGLIDLLLRPLPHAHAKAEVDRLYESGRDEPQSLKDAQAHFQRAALAETQRRQWQSALGSFAVNLAAGLVIGVGDDRPKDGAITFASGMLVTGLKMWTLPNEASGGWHDYQSYRLNLGKVPVRMAYAFRLTPTEVGFHIRF